MILEFPYNKDGCYDLERIPYYILNAVHDTRIRYPKVFNKESDMRFDQLFGELYHCRVEYKRSGGVGRIVWDRDEDYTAFLLRWA